MLTKSLAGFAFALSMIAFADAAAAAGYNASWPVTISGSNHSNGTYCLTLNSGAASLTGPFGGLPNGDFVVIGSRLVASVAYPTGSGDNAGLMFILTADKGSLGAKGAYVQDWSGYESDTGKVSVGEMGGC